MEGEVEVEEEEGERKKSLRLIFTKILPDRDNHLHSLLSCGLYEEEIGSY